LDAAINIITQKDNSKFFTFFQFRS
jgi:hypothetical protein